MRKIERWGELRPRLRSDRGTWEILVPVALSGTGKRARVNFSTEGAAEKWLSERSLEAASGRIVALSARELGGVTVAELVRLYRAEKERVLAKGSFAILTKRLRRFEAAFSGRAAGAVSGFEAKRWLGGLSGAQRSRYGVFSEVRGLYRWACRYRLLSGNPFEEMEPERKGRSAKAIFTPEQLRAVLAMELPPWFRAWVVLGAFAGLRTVEIERLDWSAVHFCEKRVFVGSDVVKQSVHELRPRYVDLLPACLRHLPAGGVGSVVPVVRTMMHFWRSRVARELCLPRWPQNGLRHSWFSYHLAHWQDAALAASQGGHVTTKMIYETYAEAVTRQAARRWWAL